MARTVRMVRMDNGNKTAAEISYERLILIVTNRCNFNCIYCPVPKGRKSMTFMLGKRAVDFFISQPGNLKEIRFFGGEPLLEFRAIKDIVDYTKEKADAVKKTVKFDITTNGTLLTKRILLFIKNNPEIEFIISLDGDKETQLVNRDSMGSSKLESYNRLMDKVGDILDLPLVTVNMVVAPNQVVKFYENFRYILSLGFRRFNFLPAFFVYWGRESLIHLKKEFNRIAGFILSAKEKIYVKNLDIFGQTPLFNNGLVVDYNGDIFFTNLIFSKHFSYLREKLKLANIKDYPLSRSVFLRPKNSDITGLIEKESDKQLFASTKKADAVLTGFVLKLKNEKSRC